MKQFAISRLSGRMEKGKMPLRCHFSKIRENGEGKMGGCWLGYRNGEWRWDGWGTDDGTDEWRTDWGTDGQTEKRHPRSNPQSPGPLQPKALSLFPHTLLNPLAHRTNTVPSSLRWQCRLRSYVMYFTLESKSTSGFPRCSHSSRDANHRPQSPRRARE